MKKGFVRKSLLFAAFVSLLCAVLFVACGNAEKFTVSAEEVAGGRISVNKTEAAAGDSVTVTCTPDEGFALKEGSLTANGAPVTGNRFSMPQEDVVVTAEFLPTDYKGTYVYSAHGSGNANIYDFIQIGESTITAGVTLENFDYAIYEDAPYTCENFVLTARVNDGNWTVEIGNGVLKKGDREYALARDGVQTLQGTYTEIPEQGNGVIEYDYAFSNGKLVCTAYSVNGSSAQEERTYRQYGNFLWISEPKDSAFANRDIRYGVLAFGQDEIALRYSYYIKDYDSAFTDTLNLYPKRESPVALKENGAYVLEESVNPYNGESWGEPKCYDFLSLRGGKLAFSRHGVHYNGRLHYIGEDTEYLRFGNVLRVSYTFNENKFVLTFHIVNDRTIYIKDTANSVQKFVFAEDVVFERAYGEPFTNEEATTYECDYYADGKYGRMIYDKRTGELLWTEEGGSYRIYGNLIIEDEAADGDTGKGIVRITEQDAQTSFLGCDYILRFVNGLWWNDTCDGQASSGEVHFWKNPEGWK